MFRSDGDRLAWMRLLKAAALEAGMDIWAYVLMRNHVHHVVVPADRGSLSAGITRCIAEYRREFDARGDSPVELWHRRPYVSAIPARYLWNAIRYVERNPVSAGVVPHAEDYPWSSAAYHCGIREKDPLILPDSPIKGALRDWASWLREPDVDRQLAAMRRSKGERGRFGPEGAVGAFEHTLDMQISRWERASTVRKSRIK